MTDAIYGCDGCRTTIGRAGCPTHRDKPAPGANLFITHCIHGLDLRLNPRCYLCKPVSADSTAGLDVEPWVEVFSVYRYGWRMDQWDAIKAASVRREALAVLGPKWPAPLSPSTPAPEGEGLCGCGFGEPHLSESARATLRESQPKSLTEPESESHSELSD